MQTKIPATVNEYIKNLQPFQMQHIKQLRELIKKQASGAEEKISYGIPAFFQNGILIYYAAFAKHYSLFPASGKTFTHFEKKLKEYRTSKGTIQFSYEKPLPAKLITAILKFRIKENTAKQKMKESKNKK